MVTAIEYFERGNKKEYLLRHDYQGNNETASKNDEGENSPEPRVIFPN